MYISAIRSLVRWCVATGRLAADRLVRLVPFDEAEDVRIQRRPMTPDEAVLLIDAAERRPVALARFFLKVQKPDGSWRDATDEDRRRAGLEHALIYKTMALTAIRKGELNGIVWGDVALDAGAICVSAKLAKSSAERLVAVRAAMVDDLRCLARGG